jgi:HSP20 family protein
METAMNALTRFERLDDLFPDMFRRFVRPVAGSAAAFDLPGEIRIDVSENEKGYEVRAEVPGVKKDDIRVTIDGNVVSIRAEVKQEKEEDKTRKGERTLVKELYYGSASRAFSLAHDVDEKAAVAKFEDGILKLSLPKKTEAASRTLNIQ